MTSTDGNYNFGAQISLKIAGFVVVVVVVVVFNRIHVLCFSAFSTRDIYYRW